MAQGESGEPGNHAPPADPDGDRVAAEASCASPGPSSHLSTCTFTGRDLGLYDLSGSAMRNIRLTNARRCGANLSSSTLTNADLRGANLTEANLGSSACRGLVTNAATRFCRTRLCSGAIDNSDCPTGVDPCCQDGDSSPRTCQSVTCNQNISTCVYTRNDDGAAGTQCPAPRRCCNGGICEPICNADADCPCGEKCCGDQCIPANFCCTEGREGCANNRLCCGGECLINSACCTNVVPGRPPGQAGNGGVCVA